MGHTSGIRTAPSAARYAAIRSLGLKRRATASAAVRAASSVRPQAKTSAAVKRAASETGTCGSSASVRAKKAGKETVRGLCSSVIYGPNASGKTNIIGALDIHRISRRKPGA